MREQFENLPRVKPILRLVKYSESSDGYDPLDQKSIYEKYADWSNGAWYAFQEQQEKIARLQSALDDLKEWAQDEKQKSLDSDLSEYNNAKYVMAALFVENINRITGADK